MRLNPCGGKILFSTVLLPAGNTTVGGLAVDRDGSAAVAFKSLDGTFLAGITPIEPAGSGVVLLIDPSGKRLAAARVPGEVRAVAIGPDGAVYVAGGEIGPSFFYSLFVAKLDSWLQSAAYIQRISGNNSGSVFASAIAIDESGNAYVTGQAGTGSSFSATSDAAFPARSNGGILLKLNPFGAVLYASHTEAPDNIPRAASSGVGIALDPNGKVYVATQGTYGLPEIGPANDRGPCSGVRIRVFAPDGSVEDSDLLVPSGFVFGFDGNRHAVVGAPQSAMPVTQGSLSANVPQPVSVVKVDYGASEAPRLLSDVDTLNFTIFYAGPSLVGGATKMANLSASGGLNVPVSIAILPTIGQGQQYFSAPEQATTPAAIPITAVTGPLATTAVFAARGLGGGLRVIPLRTELERVVLRTRLDGVFEIAEPSSRPLAARMHLSAESTNKYGLTTEFGLAYQADTEAPWLKMDNQIGVTPADLALTVDPSGLSAGAYQASVTIRSPSQALLGTANVILTIGPVFKLSGAPTSVTLPANSQPVTYPMRLTSSGSELDFQVQTPFDGVAVTPMSGRTPADLVLTLNPAKFSPATRQGIFFIGSTSGSLINRVFSVGFAPAALPPIPPVVAGAPLAPGGLIHVQAFVSCADAQATLPWPAQLGGCSVRVNGVSLPIGATVSGTAPTSYGILPRVDVLAQLPYDLVGQMGRIEISALNGVVRTTDASSDLFVAAASPQLLYNGPPAFARPWLTRADGSFSDRSNPVRTDEVVSFRISGYGRTEPAAPLGDVPNEEAPVRPVARMDAFIDGRRAEVVSAELSRTEVGVAVVRVRIPEIQPDDHLFVLRVAAGETFPAPLRIVP
jgi:uncharacterized protein (TIGR03437 family)